MLWEAPLAGDGQFRGFRNGRKMQVLLPLWQGAEDRNAARNGKPERPQSAEERSNMERRYFIGHSSRRASDGRIPETFHTETSAARIFIRNTAAATTAVTISTDSGPEVSTGQGVRVSAAG